MLAEIKCSSLVREHKPKAIDAQGGSKRKTKQSNDRAKDRPKSRIRPLFKKSPCCHRYRDQEQRAYRKCDDHDNGHKRHRHLLARRRRLRDKPEHKNRRNHAHDQPQHLETEIDGEEDTEGAIMIRCCHSTCDYDIWPANVLVAFNGQGNRIAASEA